MPNNGTLRLPLQVVGLHDEEMALEQPEDPVPTSTPEDVATGMMSILPIATASATDGMATGVMSILPVATTSKQPTKSLGVDPVNDVPKRPTRPAKPEKSKEPQPTEEPRPEESEDPQKPGGDKGGSWWDSLKETYDWAKDKFTEFVDTVTSAGS